MWMMGYSEGCEFNMPDSFTGGRLRPLIPRSIPSATNSPCLNRFNSTDYFGLNHHLSRGNDNKGELINTQAAVVVSSRWNPTPEQLRTLEELYRRGTRTPTTDQIQHITAQLRKYGKIEGKNVFYWFQNHKARERQKRRRQMETAQNHDDHDHHYNQRSRNTTNIFERKDSEASRTGYEAELTKNWALPTGSSTLAEESVSIQTAVKVALAECKVDGWIQFKEAGELQQTEGNGTWQKLQVSYSSCISTPFITAAVAAADSTTCTITTAPILTMDPKQQPVKTNDLKILVAPTFRQNGNVLDHLHTAYTNQDDAPGDSQTLQLFPLRSGDSSHNSKEKDNDISVAAVTANFTSPSEFFEFLPLKN